MNNNRNISKHSDALIFNSQLMAIRNDLGKYIRKEETSYGSKCNTPDTLMGHLERVACHAVNLAVKEGVNPICAELAGLFHDAGKFRNGQYHEGKKPEEEYSVEVFQTMSKGYNIDQTIIEQVSDAIRQLYRNDQKPNHLSMVLFDADNYDKLGLLGIANYFIKSGLRGQSITADMIIQLTVELTYARYASCRFFTKTGRSIVERRASETIRFIYDFIESLKEDGLFETRVEHISVFDLELEVITPSSCQCGASMTKNTWIEKGVKCTEIHLEIACKSCDNRYKIKFCRPMIVY